MIRIGNAQNVGEKHPQNPHNIRNILVLLVNINYSSSVRSSPVQAILVRLYLPKCSYHIVFWQIRSIYLLTQTTFFPLAADMTVWFFFITSHLHFCRPGTPYAECHVVPL
jgi:hypothetical protein